jgi:hypothetical protein
MYSVVEPDPDLPGSGIIFFDGSGNIIGSGSGSKLIVKLTLHYKLSFLC